MFVVYYNQPVHSHSQISAKHQLNRLSLQTFRSEGINLNHLSRMNLPTCIRRTCPFQILGVLGGIFLILCSNCNRTLC